MKERILANGRHTVRNGYACQIVAITEGSFAYGGHTVWDDYVRQTFA